MKKRNFTTMALTLMSIIGIFSFSLLNDGKYEKITQTRSATLQRVIDFEDLPAGNMSATAVNTIFYNGLIVADGKVTTTAKTRVDGNTLGMRLPGSAFENGITRKFTIQVSGYTKIVLDLKQERQFTLVSSGCGQSFSVTQNETIIRDIEIPTYGYHEIILTFIASSHNTSTADCGIDNIRFYGIGEGEISEDTSSSEAPPSISSASESSSEVSSVSSEFNPNNYEVTILDMANYLATKDTHYPISNAFIEEYQQKSGGYIDLAKSLGLLVDKTQHEPNQKWHFFDSWMLLSIEQGTLQWDDDARDRVYTRLLSAELLLWIYEACEVPTEKVLAAYDVAVEGKIAGTHVSTIAKNMRACVSWDDVKAAVLDYKNRLG